MGVADSHDELAHPQPVGVAEVDLDQVGGARPQHGQIGERVATDDVELHLPPVGEGRPAPLGSRDDVRRGQHVAVGGEHDAAPRALDVPGKRRSGRRPTARHARPP